MHSPSAPLRAALFSFPLVALVVLSSPQRAHAQKAYTSANTFLSSVLPGYYDETFTGNVGSASSYPFLTNGFGYTVTAGTGKVYRSGDEMETSSANTPLTFTFTTGNITAVGGNFYKTDVANNFSASAVTVTVYYLDGTHDATTYTPGSKNAFRGVTSDTPITSLVFSAPGANKYASVGSLVVGSEGPEPGALALLSAGALPLAGAAIRRRRVS